MFNEEPLIYPLLILVLALFLFLSIPRKNLRALIPYGVVLGGLLSTLKIWICQDLLNLFSFKTSGIFVCGGQFFMAPLAWTLVVVAYLYFWPQKETWLAYAYFAAWVLLATAFSQVVKKASLFDYAPWLYPFPLFLIFLARFALTTWLAKPWENKW